MFTWLTKWFSRPAMAHSRVAALPSAVVHYQGYDIHPEPVAEGGQYRINGRITRVIDGTECSYTLVRADLLPSAEQAAELLVTKAQRVIDEQGCQIFD